MTTQEIVSKLWNLCNVLRDDGITYHQYVTELTYRNISGKQVCRRDYLDGGGSSDTRTGSVEQREKDDSGL